MRRRQWRRTHAPVGSRAAVLDGLNEQTHCCLRASGKAAATSAITREVERAQSSIAASQSRRLGRAEITVDYYPSTSVGFDHDRYEIGTLNDHQMRNLIFCDCWNDGQIRSDLQPHAS